MPISEEELNNIEIGVSFWRKEGLLNDRLVSMFDLLIANVRELQSQLASRPKSRSKKQRIEDKLRASDLGAQMAGRDDIEWGHHETLPRGQHVMRLGKK